MTASVPVRLSGGRGLPDLDGAEDPSVSPEARDRYYPTEGQASDESGRFDEQNPEAADAWERLHALTTDSDVATDYLVIAE